MIVNGYLFSNDNDADIAREELNKIQYISDKLTDNPEAVLKVYNKMIESRIFITPVGIEYLRQLQDYLLKSPEISDDYIADVPVLISYQDALNYKNLEQAYEEIKKTLDNMPKHQEESASDKLKRKYKFSIAVIVAMAIMIIAMFVIALNSNTPNILNYRTEIENEYAEWAQELSEKDAELRLRENALD